MDKQYLHAKSGFNQFNCRNLGNYHDLYLASDVLLLMEQLAVMLLHFLRIG